MEHKQANPHCQTCPTREKGVFCDLMESHLDEMNRTKTANLYKPHQVIFYEGNRPYGLYCIAEGKIKIYKSDAEGHQQIVRLAGPGDILGYRSLLADEHYEATAETLETARVCFFDKRTFYHILETHPTTAFHVMKLIADDLGVAEKKTLSFTHKNVRERLAELLLVFKNRYGKRVNGGFLLDIHLTREEFSSLIGTTQESVIRAMSDFKEEGIITTEGRSITIKDTPKLIGVANLVE